ncbi:hypothetical protein, partial [Pantoea sp. UBA6567]|uniref:hypothetical protein n=1 Tax=Pantoea sp. UBA6567 TaxID=1947043 RepID=UPI00259463A0
RIRSCSARALAGVLPARPGRHSAPGAADGAPLPACKFFILFFLNLVWCALKLSDRTVSHKTHVKGKKRKPPEPTAIKKAQEREKIRRRGKRHSGPPREGTVPG